MRIAEVTAIPLSHTYSRPAGSLALGSAYKKDVVLVRVRAEDGTVGWGETHHALSPTALAEYVNSTLAQLAVGQEVHDVEGGWQRIARRVVRTHSLAGGSVTAMSGVDMALWDLRGKLLGVPVYVLLGGSRKPITAYSGSLSLGFGEPDALEREVRRLVDEGGYSAVKLRIGQGVGPDLERVRHIREAFGPELTIMVDANTSYHPGDLHRLVPGLEAAGVCWLEEPYPPDDVAALVELRGRCRVPIAVGENLHGRAQFLPVLQARAADVLQPDPSKCGGITEMKKIADLAELYHLRLAPHASHSALNYAATLHVLSSTSSAYFFEANVSENPFADDVIRGPVRPVGGQVCAPEAPGLGVEVDEARLEEFAGIPGPAYRW